MKSAIKYLLVPFIIFTGYLGFGLAIMLTADMAPNGGGRNQNTTEQLLILMYLGGWLISLLWSIYNLILPIRKRQETIGWKNILKSVTVPIVVAILGFLALSLLGLYAG